MGVSFADVAGTDRAFCRHFGAVVTHIHNHDPLNDRTGAIGLLIRLAVVTIVWMLRPRMGKAHRTIKVAVIVTGVVMAACLLVAVGGSATICHYGAPIAINPDKSYVELAIEQIAGPGQVDFQ